MAKSLLPDVNLNDAAVQHLVGLREAAQGRYTISVGRAHASLKKLSNKAAARHDDETDAANAAADLLEKFSEAVEANGDNIVASIAQSTTGSATQAAQVLELEGQLAQAQQDQAELRRGAERASNLQATVDQRDAEIASLKRQLSACQAEVQEFRDAPTRPNPLNEQVRTLQGQLNDLNAQLTTAGDEKAALEQELEGVKEELEKANDKIAQLEQGNGDPVVDPPAPVVPDPVASASQPAAPVDPDSQSGDPTDPPTMVGGFQGQPTPAPQPKKGWWGKARRLPS